MRLTLIAGLPGSGKTTLLRDLAGQGAMTVDDIARLDALPASPVPWLAIADVNFCKTGVRLIAEDLLCRRYHGEPISIEWLFFANDPDQCLANAAARADGRKVGPDVRVLAARYVIPPGATVLDVYRPPAQRP